MNIFVGNLSFEAKEEDVQRIFSAFGVVTSVTIVMEKKGGKSRGFGFVEMPDEQEAQGAIANLNGKEVLGRPINVMPSSPKKPKNKILTKKNTRPQVFKRTGKYREGRRTISYMKQRLESGITASAPRRRIKPNPLRWPKKPRPEARFAKPAGGLKPWQRPQTESNPWKKPLAKSGAWRKPAGGSKVWRKPEGEKRQGAPVAAGWRKSSSSRRKVNFKKRGNSGRYKNEIKA